jgi:DNA-binding NarL/FixJ family response regulator
MRAKMQFKPTICKYCGKEYIPKATRTVSCGNEKCLRKRYMELYRKQRSERSNDTFSKTGLEILVDFKMRRGLSDKEAAKEMNRTPEAVTKTWEELQRTGQAEAIWNRIKSWRAAR